MKSTETTLKGLEQDVLKILDYFGKDFIAPEVKQQAVITMQQTMMSQLAFQMQSPQMFQPPAFPLISA